MLVGVPSETNNLRRAEMAKKMTARVVHCGKIIAMLPMQALPQKHERILIEGKELWVHERVWVLALDDRYVKLVVGRDPRHDTHGR